MGTELVIVAVILSLFIGIIVETGFEPAIASAEAGAIASTAATANWNEFAGAEIALLELIPFILSFSGSLDVISSVMYFMEIF